MNAKEDNRTDPASSTPSRSLASLALFALFAMKLSFHTCTCAATSSGWSLAAPPSTCAMACQLMRLLADLELCVFFFLLAALSVGSFSGSLVLMRLQFQWRWSRGYCLGGDDEVEASISLKIRNRSC
jgi:hypothetical protein